MSHYPTRPFTHIGSNAVPTLHDVAMKALEENGFIAGFAPEIERETAGAATRTGADDDASVIDLRALLWSSIDNAESRDLDQVEVAEALPEGATRLRIGIADVDRLVPRGSATDVRAAANTTSVYAGADVFPMLPTELSTGLTSLNEGEERVAVVVDLTVDSSGKVTAADAYRARLVNRAKLAYEDVGRWLEGAGPAPAALATHAGLDAQLRLQDATAQRLRALRHRNGALELETIEARPVMEAGRVVRLELTRKSRARELIEDFMIAANSAMARLLDAKGSSSIRRIVHTPQRWPRIVELAATLGVKLPDEPDAAALARFLTARRAADPDHFPDLSLAVVKLMGPGEYALDRAGETATGHFGLAVLDYTHSTAPNRRFADLVTQRLVKAVLRHAPAPYSDGELAEIAARCTQKENDARKIERVVRKAAAALLLHDRIGDTFDAIVTGVSPKGTFVRLIDPPAEGRVMRGEAGADVGDRLRVKLVATDVERGFVDFERLPLGAVR